jgi:hypothetical protein
MYFIIPNTLIFFWKTDGFPEKNLKQRSSCLLKKISLTPEKKITFIIHDRWPSISSENLQVTSIKTALKWDLFHCELFCLHAVLPCVKISCVVIFSYLIISFDCFRGFFHLACISYYCYIANYSKT